MSANILICDDQEVTHEAISIYLREEGMSYESAFDGKQALEYALHNQYDLIILDLMMPKLSGLEVCKAIRKSSDIPILMLTAKGEEMDRITGLEIGADDYIVKPFSPKEIVIRIQNILRRVKPKEIVDGQRIVFPGLIIDLDRYEVMADCELIKLTPKEVELLYVLAKNSGQVLGREQLLNKIWGYNYLGDTRAVDTQIKRLRQKLPISEHYEIKSIYGVGYKFEVMG